MAQDDQITLQHPVRTFFRFLRFLLPYWDKALFICLYILVTAPLIQIEALVRRAMIDKVLMNDIDPVGVRLNMLWFLFGLVIVIVWSGQLLERMNGFFRYYLGMFLTMDLRKRFYRHLHRLPYRFFQDRPIGEHMYRCLEDIRSDAWPVARGVVDMISSSIPTAFQRINDIFWQGMVVLVLNPMAALFIGVTIVPYTVLSYWMNTRIKRAFIKLRHEEQTVPAILRDSVAGVETVKSYGRTRTIASRYVHQLIKAIRAVLRRDYLQVTLDHFVFWALDFIAIGSLWLYLVYQLMIKEISVGTFYVLLGLSTRFIGPFKDLVKHWQDIRQMLVPAQRMLETLDVEPAIQDLPNAKRLPQVAGRIRFENVSFAYDPAVPVLKNLSFEAAPGQTIGIVGRSGAGKTTILNLLLRLHRPDSGRVLLDDHDLDKIKIASWQDQLAIVMQHTFLFGGDVAYNIRYGNMDATDEEIQRALEMADADEFVAQLPEGIHSDLAEGSKLSGGQKQRLGIARALVRKPRVLILDEPTSSLDSRTENEIWRSFEKAMEGNTTIVISHRLSTVRKADRILVLDKGEIVEQGTHDELVEQGGLYAGMWRDQTGGAA